MINININYIKINEFRIILYFTYKVIRLIIKHNIKYIKCEKYNVKYLIIFNIIYFILFILYYSNKKFSYIIK